MINYPNDMVDTPVYDRDFSCIQVILENYCGFFDEYLWQAFFISQSIDTKMQIEYCLLTVLLLYLLQQLIFNVLGFISYLNILYVLF